MQSNYTFLALGDSYTIGEAVLLTNNFPYQLIQMLRKKGFNFAAPEIIAKTGWTTSELEDGMKNYKFLSNYDFVSLLIGVNNQYRALDVMQFKMDLENLLTKAISLANNKTERVIILSIPDYSITPFALTKEPEKIAKEIDVFNSIIKVLSIQYKVHYIDITTGSRKAKDDATLIAADGLHPSAKLYKKWADKLSAFIAKQIK